MNKRPNTISADLGALKQPWLAWCAKQRMQPSEALRQVLAKVMHGDLPVSVPRSAEVRDRAEKPRVRVEVHLTESEHRLLKPLARAEGFAVTKWIVALIRARLIKHPQFGQSELESLARSNQQLLAIGRNLNQLAKALNTSPQDRRAFRVDLITELSSRIQTHTKTVSNVMRGNLERWQIR
ncbi:MAG: hypothetical protein ABIU05_27945 [Nitrospirales bacterium]